MSKKRAVLVSSVQPKGMGKSKSAKNNLPLPPLEHFQPGTRSGELAKMTQDDMAESHLASQPQKMINQAHYTYQESEYRPQPVPEKVEEPEEEFIQPMARRQVRQNVEVPKQKASGQQKQTAKAVKQRKINEKKKSKSNPGLTGHIRIPLNLHKDKEKKDADKTRRFQRKEFNPETVRPRPLAYNVNMFDKGVMHSPQKHHRHGNLLQQSERVPTIQDQQPEDDLKKPKYGQNLNCNKLPFRLQAKA